MLLIRINQHQLLAINQLPCAAICLQHVHRIIFTLELFNQIPDFVDVCDAFLVALFNHEKLNVILFCPRLTVHL